MPARSLNRSSRCGARTSGVRAESGSPELAAVTGVVVATGVALATGFAAATEAAGATELAGATEVSDDELPQSSRTLGETGSVRSPAWNNERKIGSVGGEVLVVVEADATVTGVTVRTSGKLER